MAPKLLHFTPCEQVPAEPSLLTPVKWTRKHYPVRRIIIDYFSLTVHIGGNSVSALGDVENGYIESVASPVGSEMSMTGIQCPVLKIILGGID